MIAPNSSGKAVVVVCFIFPTIAALAIVARFHARKAKKLRLQVDDYVIVASWASIITNMSDLKSRTNIGC